MELTAENKKYVGVSAMHRANGQCCPMVIDVDGSPYRIQDIREIKLLVPRDWLGAEEMYRIEVEGRERYLFREDQSWFVIPGMRRTAGKEKERGT